jgi:dolichyl-diphosphooligosaccharide--protein glycosyltransferase
VGKKNIELTTMDEAFTSEHWIVRIYKVRHRPNLEPTKAAKKSLKKLYRKSVTASSKSPVEEVVDEGSDVSTENLAKYIGCYSSESFFEDKVYEGGSTGANYNQALHNAISRRKKYFAVARAGSDGHSFAFSYLSDDARPGGNMFDESCDRPCEDITEKSCGCCDSFCKGPLPKGEEHNRRWTVYEVSASASDMA